VGGGELSGAPVSASNGHLVVIVGFTAAGDPVVNDPAANTAAGVRHVYDRAEFENAWLPKSGGVVYVIHDAAHTAPGRARPGQLVARCSRRTGSRARRARRPVRLHRQPGQQPVARMRDVLGTIQADQDAIIRAGSRGALVVDGGPGTGRPSSPCTAPPTSSTPTRTSATTAAACCSSARTSRT
jgi:hypothetical protein